MISHRKARSGQAAWRHLLTNSLVSFQGNFPGCWWWNERGGNHWPEGGGLDILVQGVETWRDGSTSRAGRSRPDNPYPIPTIPPVRSERRRGGRPVSILRCPCYTRSEIVVLGYAFRRTNDATRNCGWFSSSSSSSSFTLMRISTTIPLARN